MGSGDELYVITESLFQFIQSLVCFIPKLSQNYTGT